MGHAVAGDGSVQALAVSGSAGEGGYAERAPDDGVGQPSGSKWCRGWSAGEGVAVSAGG